MARSESDLLGLRPTDVLSSLARRGETTTASNFAKHNHYSIAVLSSIGLISSLTRDGIPTTVWRVTYAGHSYLERHVL
jgi:hypothetical protein